MLQPPTRRAPNGLSQRTRPRSRAAAVVSRVPRERRRGVVGCLDSKRGRPVQVLSPYDVPPGPWRRAWMEAFVKWQKQQQQHNPVTSSTSTSSSSSMPLLLYWLDGGGDGDGEDSQHGKTIDNTNIRNPPKAVSDSSSDSRQLQNHPGNLGGFCQLRGGTRAGLRPDSQAHSAETHSVTSTDGRGSAATAGPAHASRGARRCCESRRAKITLWPPPAGR